MEKRARAYVKGSGGICSRGSGRIGATVLAALLLAVAPSSWSGPDKASHKDASKDSLREIGNAFSEVAHDAMPAVVAITSRQKIGGSDPDQGAPRRFDIPENSPLPEEFWRRFFGLPRQGPQRDPGFQRMAQGSGVIVSEDGYILTNSHIVQNAEKIRVKLRDGRQFEAELVGADKKSDVAVIKIEGEDFPTLPVGNPKEMDIGDWVVAVGNPFGLSATVTTGIISAKGRSNLGITDYENFIQTDAAINPGNSGGPLLNLDGELIGMNTAILSRHGGYMGIGFAIPINMAIEIKRQLVEEGGVRRGQIGIYIQPITQALAQSFDLEKAKGILVADVMDGSPGEKAGLKQGDIILQRDGKPVNDIGSFRNNIAMAGPGKEVALTILRDGEEKTIEVTLGAKSEVTKAEKKEVPEQPLKKYGVVLQDMTPALSQRFGYEKDAGVVISEIAPRSPAARAGLRPGQLISSINREPVSSLDEIRSIVSEAEKGETLLLLVKDDQATRFVALQVE